MLRRICLYLLFPVVALLMIGQSIFKEDIEYALGEYEFSYLLGANALFICAIIFLSVSSLHRRYTIVACSFYVASLFTILGYSALPENRYNRAKEHYLEFKNKQLVADKEDPMYQKRVEYLKIEQTARELEFQAEELRYYGPEEYYSWDRWQYILFGFSILISFGYGIGWIFVKTEEQ